MVNRNVVYVHAYIRYRFKRVEHVRAHLRSLPLQRP